MTKNTKEAITDRMTEAEVTLRLAEYLFLTGAKSPIIANIDGASVRCNSEEIFPITEFLNAGGWQQRTSPNRDWRGEWRKAENSLIIKSRPGEGDLIADMGTHRIIAECKKGPKRRIENSILSSVIGQALILDGITEKDMVIVAVPDTGSFRRLKTGWLSRPLFRKTRIEIWLVNRDGTIN